ncbi:hypothetical protein GIB67_034780 [Kingdonia uniflora]|uniref:Uncharacterized protein n=1 Tax=Kingdonia uniflora TaxID=39325 RepID=A0A7J7ME83_9MAGN|nr:hypothetical protein GIB67_034780 [Kingdonia uniflora]
MDVSYVFWNLIFYTVNHTPSSYTAERTSSISRADSVYYPHNGMMEVSHNIIPAQTSQMEMIHGMNGIVIKLESDYSNGSAFTFGADGNVRPTIGDTSGATYSSVESNSEPLNEQPLVDNDISSFGFLGQIPRNFSLSDLTADFSQSTGGLSIFNHL